MKLTFKMSENKDGSTTLWFSHHGKLHKVVRYTQETLDQLSDVEARNVQERDAAIFYRGWAARK